MNCFLMESTKSNTRLMTFYDVLVYLKKKESAMEIKSLLFTENVAVFAYPASKTTPSIFQSHQESRDVFGVLQKAMCF